MGKCGTAASMAAKPVGRCCSWAAGHRSLRAGGVTAPGEAEEAKQVPVAHAAGVHRALGPAKVAAEGGDLRVGGALQRRQRAAVENRLARGAGGASVARQRVLQASLQAAMAGMFTILRLPRSRHRQRRPHLLGGVGGSGEHAARAAVVLGLGRQAEVALQVDGQQSNRQQWCT